MKEINIEKVSNGYVVLVTRRGNQYLYDHTEVFIAKDKSELLEIIENNT